MIRLTRTIVIRLAIKNKYRAFFLDDIECLMMDCRWSNNGFFRIDNFNIFLLYGWVIKATHR